MQKWLFFITVLLLAACTKKLSTPDEPQKLKLSVTDETVYTDGMTYSFDIVSGNGNYRVAVTPLNPYATIPQATLSGEHVKVNLLNERTTVTVTDKDQQIVSFSIISSDKALVVPFCDYSMPYGAISKAKVFTYGGGKYKILQQNGDAAQVSIDEEDLFSIRSVKPGKTSLLIGDKYGITAEMLVRVQDGWDLTSGELSVTAKGGQLITFPLKYGEGGWKILSPVSDDPFTFVMPKGELYEQDLLQVRLPEESKEPVVYTLEDKSGKRAVITIRLEGSVYE